MSPCGAPGSFFQSESTFLPRPPPPPTPPPTPPAPPKPSQFYACTHTTNYTCVAANGSLHGQPQAQCEARCVKPTPKPNTPTNLVGYWRGFQIQKGFAKGEFDFDFTTAGCTLYGADKKATTATVQSVTDPASLGTDLWLTMSGKTIKGLVAYASNSPESFVGIFAFGAAGAEAPASVTAAMAAGGTVCQQGAAPSLLPPGI